ncbi:SIMPL domain-containing protein [Agrobacterium vitis]|uniref:SIMPL domain-containing protein n=1 Tax=Agrobacterium vitis TaxID=373 RepID=UPI0020363731|nr:SIMPL domain-containing protein [Agrobacterium vitis]MCM2452828.1 SIMPL domain-containing protein [Agrobacterium vitis]
MVNLGAVLGLGRLGFVLASLAVVSPAMAQEASRQEAVINVSGEGEVSLAPDMALMQLGVVTEATEAAQALKDNNEALAKVLKSLKDKGLADRDLQTSGFQITPRYRQEPEDKTDSRPPVIDGYSVSNGLTIRVRDLSKLGGVIDTSVGLGVKQGGEIRFTNDKPDSAIDEARKSAMADAMAKAKVLTQAAGVKLGRIISINENSARPFEQGMMMKARMAQDMAPAPTPMAAGENIYRVTVNVSFALEQ